MQKKIKVRTVNSVYVLISDTETGKYTGVSTTNENESIINRWVGSDVSIPKIGQPMFYTLGHATGRTSNVQTVEAVQECC